MHHPMIPIIIIIIIIIIFPYLGGAGCGGSRPWLPSGSPSSSPTVHNHTAPNAHNERHFMAEPWPHRHNMREIRWYSHIHTQRTS
jgi:hypothetical protein